MVPLFGAAYAAPNKGTSILYLFRSPKTMLNPPINGKIQGLLKAFECFFSAFQGKFYFQVLLQDSPVYMFYKYFSSLCEPWYTKKNAKLPSMPRVHSTSRLMVNKDFRLHASYYLQLARLPQGVCNNFMGQ